MQVLLLDDVGCGPFVTGCLAAALGSNVVRVGLDTLVRGDFDANVLAFPGGADRPWLEPLAAEGNANIRRFVESGGTFLGVCAGAYYACRGIDFDGVGLRTRAARELDFFPGTGVGPLVELAPRDAEDEVACALAARITHAGGEFHALYWGGCRFAADEGATGVEVLARYADLPDDADVAAVRVRIGRGQAILTGFHAEVSRQDFRNTYGRDLPITSSRAACFLRSLLSL